jgi:hypothetical protein
LWLDQNASERAGVVGQTSLPLFILITLALSGRETKMVSSGQIKEVHFERVFNLGNYESFRIGLTATVGPKQTAEEVVVMLDEFTIKLRNKRVKEKG